MDDLAALARGEGWTEERHAAFLDRMELSFVQQLLVASDVRQASRRLGRRPAAPPRQAGGGGGGGGGGGQAALPLDRPLPDSAVESNRGAGAPSRSASSSGPAAGARRRAAGGDARRPVDPAAGW